MTDGELDALVAEKVMGYAFWRSKHGHWIVDDPSGAQHEPLFGAVQRFDPSTGEKNPEPLWYDGIDLPAYSTDIAAAWQVVEKMKSLSTYEGKQFCNRQPWMNFCDHLAGRWHDGFNIVFWDVTPRAICLAALAAVGVEVK